MKLQSLTIKNIGIIADTTIKLDKPLLLFYGEIRQGKSTILAAIVGEKPAAVPEHVGVFVVENGKVTRGD